MTHYKTTHKLNDGTYLFDTDEFFVNDKCYEIIKNGGVYQLRSMNSFITLNLNNSYNYDEVVQYVIDNFNCDSKTRTLFF